VFLYFENCFQLLLNSVYTQDQPLVWWSAPARTVDPVGPGKKCATVAGAETATWSPAAARSPLFGATEFPTQENTGTSKHDHHDRVGSACFKYFFADIGLIYLYFFN